jgi:hypothetical protein
VKFFANSVTSRAIDQSQLTISSITYKIGWLAPFSALLEMAASSIGGEVQRGGLSLPIGFEND